MYIKYKRRLCYIFIIFAFIFLFNIVLNNSSKIYASVKEYNDFRITAYCPEPCCSEGYGTMTATGKVAKVNHTIAVDPTVIPYGSKVVIDGIPGIIFIAEDTGGEIDNHEIDVYVAKHSDVNTDKFNTNGKYNRKVRVYSSDTSDSKIQDFSQNSGLSSDYESAAGGDESTPKKSDGSVDYTQIGANTVKEIIQAEKYNFNKVQYSVRTANKYKNGKVSSQGSIKNLSDWDKNHTITDTGLKIPSLSTYDINPGGSNTDKEEIYLDMLSPYMQKWFIPYTLMVDTADEDYVLDKVMGEMYHPVNVTLFALNKLTKTTEKKYYMKCQVTEYVMEENEEGKKVKTFNKRYQSNTKDDPSSSATFLKEIKVLDEIADDIELAGTKVKKDYSISRYVPKIVYAGTFYEIIEASYKVEPINENGSSTYSYDGDLQVDGDYGTISTVEEWEETIVEEEYDTSTYKVSYYNEEDYASLGRKISRIEWYQDYNNYLHKSDSSKTEDKNKTNEVFPKKKLNKTDEIKRIPSLKESYEKYKDAYGYDYVSFAYAKIEEMFEKVESEAAKNNLLATGPCFTFPIPAYVGKKKLSEVQTSEVSISRTISVNGVVSTAAHTGTDLADGTAPDIVAAAAGKVLVAGFDADGYGNYVKIQHDNGYSTLYGHMVSTPLVKTGDTVEAGQKLGVMGTTGYSTGVHLHFEIIDDSLSGLDRYKKVSEFFDDDLNPICVGECSTLGGIKLGSALTYSNYKNAKKYYSYAEKYGNQFGIDPNIVVAMIAQESGGNPSSDNGAAYGLMQWEYKSNGSKVSAKRMDGSTFSCNNVMSYIRGNPEHQIEVGCAELRNKANSYGGNLLVALQGYNFGQGGIRRCISYYLSGGKNTSEKWCGISESKYKEYIASNDTGWLSARSWYKNTGHLAFSGAGGGDPKYLENVFRFYNTRNSSTPWFYDKEGKKIVLTDDGTCSDGSGSVLDNGKFVEVSTSAKYYLKSKTNGKFGWFPYRPASDGEIEIDPEWIKKNTVTVNLKCLNLSVQVHRVAKNNFTKAFNSIDKLVAEGTLKKSDLKYNGCFYPRYIRGSTSKLSNHSWGTAIDFNAYRKYKVNGKKYSPYDYSGNAKKQYNAFVKALGSESDTRNVNYILWKRAFEPAGFEWGGNWSENYFDAMHYEVKK